MGEFGPGVCLFFFLCQSLLSLSHSFLLVVSGERKDILSLLTSIPPCLRRHFPSKYITATVALYHVGTCAGDVINERKLAG